MNFSNIKEETIVRIGILGVGNIMNAGMGFLFILAAARSLNADDFGKYILLTTLMVSTAKIIDFGTNSYFVAHSIRNNTEFLSDFINVKKILFLIALIIGISALLFFNFSTPLIYISYVLGLAAYLVNYTMYGVFHKNERFVYLFSLNFLPGFVKGLLGLLIFTGIISLPYQWYFLIFCLSVFASFFLLPKAKINLNKITGFELKESLNLIKKTYKAGLSQIINESWPAINNGIIRFFSNFTNVAVYSIADKLSDVFSLLSLAIFTVLLPKNARTRSKNQKYDFKEIILLSISVITLALVCYLASIYIINNFLGPEYQKSIALLGILIFNSALISISAFMEHHFYIEEKPEYLIKANASRLISLLLISSITIGSYGIYGLALANTVSSVITLLIIILSIKKIDIY